MAYIIQLRQDTAANFTAANPILAQGEPALEIDTTKEKLGNGVDSWVNLPYRNQDAATLAAAKIYANEQDVINLQAAKDFATAADNDLAILIDATEEDVLALEAGKEPLNVPPIANLKVKVYNLDGSVSYEDYGVGTAVERTRKEVSNTTSYTLVLEDYTTKYLDFTADLGQTIALNINTGIIPANGQAQIISSGNNFIVPTAGTGITFIKPPETNLKTVGKGSWLGIIETTTADSLSINGSLESTAAGGGISDAPSDGTPYSRQDASWVAAIDTDTSYAPFTNSVDGLVPAPNISGTTTYSGAITSPTQGFTITEGVLITVTASESSTTASGTAKVLENNGWVAKDLRLTILAGDLSVLEQDVIKTKISALSKTIISGGGTAKGDALRIINPEGGMARHFYNNVAGAIKITFPVSTTHSSVFAIDFEISGRQYGGNPVDSAKIHISGQTNSALLVDKSITTLVSDNGIDYPVRFGNDGVNFCIWIAETTHIFDYVTTAISNLYVGRVNTGSFDDWKTPFDISRVTSFDTVQLLMENNLPIADFNKLENKPVGVSGTFTTVDSKTVTVTNGIITSIV